MLGCKTQRENGKGKTDVGNTHKHISPEIERYSGPSGKEKALIII